MPGKPKAETHSFLINGIKMEEHRLSIKDSRPSLAKGWYKTAGANP